jgi:hypothetical protein
MAEQPFRFIDRRGTGSYAQNTLIQAASSKNDRQTIPAQDYDFHRTISTSGRRNLASLGLWMFWNIPELQGAVLEQADLALSSFAPQFYGEDQDWGYQEEQWLESWHNIFDVAGPPYDGRFFRQSLTLLPIVVGDMGILLTQGESGYPMIQLIPSHRIGSRSQTESVVKGGLYDGARIIDGVIVNDYYRPIAYRVFMSDDSNGEYRDISTRDMVLHFYPVFPGQLRGLSLLASSAFDWQDKRESKRFEMMAQKACAANALIEHNESGEADSAKDFVTGSSAASATASGAPEMKMLDGGIYRYFKANTNSKLEPFHYDRPGANSQRFQEMLVRDAFRGIEWDSFFSLDPSAVGGAPMRVIVDRINRVLNKRREAARKTCLRVDTYGVAKAIKSGFLPENKEWYKIYHYGPGDITADRKYESDVDLQELGAGATTLQRVAAKRGDHWRDDVRKQQDVEIEDLLTRAKEKSDKFGISIEQAVTLFRETGSYSTITNTTAKPEDKPAAKPIES